MLLSIPEATNVKLYKNRNRAVKAFIKLLTVHSMKNASYLRLVLWKAAKAVERVDRASIDGTGLHLSDFQIMELLLHKGPQPINTIG
jgi:hypothetical protein